MRDESMQWSTSALSAAIRHAIGRATRAPSIHNSQPWHFRVDGDTISLRADRSRQLIAIDPRGRELAISIGSALFNLRVGLAARVWGAEVSRLPYRHDPDLMALVTVFPGRPEAEIAPLEPAIARRQTNRRRFGQGQVPEDLLAMLSEASGMEQTLLVPIRSPGQRDVVTRLTQRASLWQDADPRYVAEIQRWTARPTASGDGIPATVVPRVDGRRPADGLPLRVFDTAGAGGLPADVADDEQTLLLLATSADEPTAWLRCGEAVQRVLLELTQRGWVASPVTQALEVPVTRAELGTSLCSGAHPQMLLRVGRASVVPPTPRRVAADVVQGTDMSPTIPRHPANPAPSGRSGPDRRPASDGRGGTTWV